MTFDTKINPEIFGNRLAPSFKDEKNQWQRDYIMVLFRGQSVNPTKIKSGITLCLESDQAVASTDACKEFGKEIASDIYLVEGLQNQDNNMYAYYNLYAITSRVQLNPNERIKIVVNLDVDKEGEANVGKSEQIFDVDGDSSLDWRNQYNNEIKGENNNSIASPNHRFFYVGSGS